MAKRFKWTFDAVFKVALTFDTKIDFQNGNENAYKAALRQGIDKFCTHMTSLYIYWNEDSIQLEANKFNSKNDFRNNSHKAFDAAKKIGLDKFCTHMNGGRFILTEEYIASEALKFNTKTNFCNGSNSAYQAAKRLGIMGIVCAHMVIGSGGFDATKPAIFYYLKIEEDANIFYKLGITNRNIKSRISSMKIDKKYKYSILQELHFDIGADASKLELNLKHINNKYQYKGEPIMKNGNTEVFIIDILGLDI